MNCSPSMNARTPGQLLSLTSHLSFGSGEKIKLSKNHTESNPTSNLMHALNQSNFDIN